MSDRAYVIVVVVTIAMVVGIIRQVRMRRLRAKYALLWLAVGLFVTPIALVPDLLDRIASLLGIAYPPALLLVIGLGFFALLSLHFSSELTRLEECTRVLAEEAALLRHAIGVKADRAIIDRDAEVDRGGRSARSEPEPPTETMPP